MTNWTRFAAAKPFVQVGEGHGPLHGGLGSGLALAKSLVRMHGGTIEARSRGLGQGSEFVIALPLDGIEEPSLSTPASDRAPELFGTVLIVDDKPDNVSTLAMLLALPNHRVHTAGSGEEALRRADALRPDVILMDIGLPGMSG